MSKVCIENRNQDLKFMEVKLKCLQGLIKYTQPNLKIKVPFIQTIIKVKTLTQLYPILNQCFNPNSNNLLSIKQS